MNSYTIGKDKVKIRLTEEEVKELFGGYEKIDYECPRARAVIDSLICGVLPESMLPLDCKKVLIEVRAEYDGCSILFTRIYETPRRLHKANSFCEYILLFKDSEDMFTFAEQLDPAAAAAVKESRLIKINDKFALCLKGGDMLRKNITHFKEYGIVYTQKQPQAAVALEHGDILCENALQKLKKAF